MDYTRRSCAKCRTSVAYDAILEKRATVWDQMTFCESCSSQLRVLLDAYPGLRSEILLSPEDESPSGSSEEKPRRERGRFFGLFG